ncbi:MAG: thioredoxin domain-containing protein [Myxococcales bacterium]|nr:thioredoxin domain-containing protein [Myxococcales bacterium]MCB9715126.1 thioredoxin domain-containing protein [Myxococcales bacterium]
MTATKEARRRGILLLAMVVLALLGVADGWWLTMVHVDYELGKASELVQVCGKLSARGCAVTSGRFGTMMGIPVSVLGLGGAAATALAAGMAWRRRALDHDPWRGTAFALAAFSVLSSVLMGTLSALEGSFCPFCVAWYVINLGLGLCAWFSLGYAQDTSLARILKDAMGPVGLAVLATFMLSFSAGYWGYGQRRAAVRAEMERDLDALVTALLEAEKPVEISLEGLPTKGPEDAPLTVVEVADFQCPHCRKLWEGISAYTKGPTPVRVAFVHYPLDDSCNPGMQGVHPMACKAAEAAECARQQDRFFEYGDLLFAHQPAFERDELVGYAKELGLDEAAFTTCLDSELPQTELKRSIARAILMEVDATPTFFVNGYKFRGARPPDWIEVVFDRLARDATGAGAKE